MYGYVATTQFSYSEVGISHSTKMLVISNNRQNDSNKLTGGSMASNKEI